MLILGYIGALIVGGVLGMLGGGGSVLTVPILVYVLKIDPILATTYSLFIVGISSLVGAVKNAQKKRIEYKLGIKFAIPTLTAVFLTRKYILPAIPETLFEHENLKISKDIGIMLLFAIVMLVSSYYMIKRKRQRKGKRKQIGLFLIALIGILIGVIAGIVGAGGGFLITPTLVLFLDLRMKRAVATSLLIVSIQALIGFTGGLDDLEINWFFLTSFSLISIAGIFIGVYINNFVKEAKLKRGFGWFVLVMGISIILLEVFVSTS